MALVDRKIPMGSPESAKAFLEGIISCRLDSGVPGNFDTVALGSLKDIRATSSRVLCTLFVSPQVQNRYGTLHGGCIATIVDTVGTAALLTKSKRSGVSLALSVDYLSPQPGLEECDIIAEVVKTGKTIATISVEVRQSSTHKLVALGRHIKFLAENETSPTPKL